ncbi:hypothetical protein [Candidatus Poriferisodalis sp.]|uniref:hypothetical protein n=1 Tax=Candidatus Poriferisodalis sp. TaxID=3101277 RepID=UPI003B5267E1
MVQSSAPASAADEPHRGGLPIGLEALMVRTPLVALLIAGRAGSGLDPSSERTCEAAVTNIFALGAEADSIASRPLEDPGEAEDIYDDLIVVHGRFETALIQAKSRGGDSVVLDDIEAVLDETCEATAKPAACCSTATWRC